MAIRGCVKECDIKYLRGVATVNCCTLVSKFSGAEKQVQQMPCSAGEEGKRSFLHLILLWDMDLFG